MWTQLKKDFRVTDSLGLKHFRLKGMWRLHDLGVKPSSACCELRTLQRDHVQWITAADTPSCGQKNTHAGPQRIPSADVPSCGQKRHTRWPGLQRMLRHAMNYWPATNSKCWCAIMRSEKTYTLACNECFGMQWMQDAVLNPWVLPDNKRICMRTCSSMDFETTIRRHKLSGFGSLRVCG